MTIEQVSKSSFLVHLNTHLHGTFKIQLPKDLQTIEDAGRITKHLLDTNTRASTATKYKPQVFEDTNGTTIKLTYLGGACHI